MDENTGDVAPTNSETARQERWAKWARPAAFGAAGLLAGGLFAGTLSASATDSTPDGSTSSTSPARPHGAEKPLTGSTADKVKAAVLAKYPGAAILRLETDSDGVYEAHITTGSGEQLEVKVDKAFTVTGAQAHRGGGRGGPCPPGPAETGDGATGTSLTT